MRTVSNEAPDLDGIEHAEEAAFQHGSSVADAEATDLVAAFGARSFPLLLDLSGWIKRCGEFCMRSSMVAPAAGI
jgi:hypothetical protein